MGRACADCGVMISKPRQRFCPLCRDERRLEAVRQYKSRERHRGRVTARSTSDRIYKVVSCPGDEWPINVILCATDVRETLRQAFFPVGLVFERNGAQFRVSGVLCRYEYLEEVR